MLYSHSPRRFTILANVFCKHLIMTTSFILTELGYYYYYYYYYYYHCSSSSSSSSSGSSYGDCVIC